jgi:hypothetical protein
VGEKTADLDVTFGFARGGAVGASRLLRAPASHYYRCLFASSAAGANNVVLPDKDLPRAAHEAPLRQLHASSELPLQKEPTLLRDLLALCAKKRAPPAGGDEKDAVAHMAERCEDAMIASLDVSNRLDVLLRFKQGGGFARLINGARRGDRARGGGGRAAELAGVFKAVPSGCVAAHAAHSACVERQGGAGWGSHKRLHKCLPTWRE